MLTAIAVAVHQPVIDPATSLSKDRKDEDEDSDLAEPFANHLLNRHASIQREPAPLSDRRFEYAPIL